MSGSITVFGSVNIDEVARVHTLPEHGETVLSYQHEMHTGGKGANQAVAAARAGAPVRLVGAVGHDHAAFLLENLEREGISCSLRICKVPTGRAIILVQDDGENVITVIPGANRETTIDDIEKVLDGLSPQDVLLMQLELPLEWVKIAAKRAKAKGAKIVLNAAPAQRNIELHDIDVLVVNERECLQTAGRQPNTDSSSAALELATMYDLTVVVTLGANGATFVQKGTIATLPSPIVTAIDTTGAGDTFVGYLTRAMLADVPLQEAVELAVQAGSMAVTREGAQPSIPWLHELSPRPHPVIQGHK